MRDYCRMAFKPLSLLFVALLMANCADKPTHLELTITSGTTLNPDRDNISSPLMLNFYELKDAEQFSKLGFWALVDEPAKRLEGDLVSQAKHVIVPREEQVYKILLNDESRFLGIIGSFRNIDDNATWRFVKNLDLKSYNEVDLYVDRYMIREVE
jgi:type VI secretion system protein VasD